MWATVNTIQMVSHLVLIRLKLPSNMKQFVGYMAYGNSMLNSIPGIPNFVAMLIDEKELNMNPYNDMYENSEYPSRNVMILCGPEIQTLIGLMIITPVVYGLSRVIPYFKILDEKLRYAALTRTIIEGYLKFCMCAFLNFGLVFLIFIQKKDWN